MVGGGTYIKFDLNLGEKNLRFVKQKFVKNGILHTF